MPLTCWWCANLFAYSWVWCTKAWHFHYTDKSSISRWICQTSSCWFLGPSQFHPQLLYPILDGHPLFFLLFRTKHDGATFHLSFPKVLLWASPADSAFKVYLEYIPLPLQYKVPQSLLEPCSTCSVTISISTLSPLNPKNNLRNGSRSMPCFRETPVSQSRSKFEWLSLRVMWPGCWCVDCTSCFPPCVLV